MTQFYSRFSVLKCTKSFLLFASFLFVSYASLGQTYYGSFSGAAEAPPNSSLGTGKFLVTITGNNMRVQCVFSGLSGTVTASHIHAATAVAGTGTAGVATTTPTFTGFPSGVTAGTYDHTYDMTQASSYNPSYVTANGGTTASAFTALKAAMAAGKAYWNIHSTVVMGGEIRGFLIACPTISVSIPDALALSQGVLPNTVYPAYSPASSLILQANVSGGTGPYLYSWSNGGSGSSITISPSVTTTYSVTATDQNGCSGSGSKTVNVMDISSGKNGANLFVCHNSNTIAVNNSAVPAHLNHGDMLGNCNAQSVTAHEIIDEQTNHTLSVKVLSNPSSNYFELQISSQVNMDVQLTVFDLQGRIVESKPALRSNQTVRVGTLFSPGVYLARIVQGAEVKTIRLIKTN